MKTRPLSEYKVYTHENELLVNIKYTHMKTRSPSEYKVYTHENKAS